jgi:hypothetical protein
MILIGGGVGMAPLRAIILDQLERIGSKRKISFWYGARSLRELYYAEEFDALAEEAQQLRAGPWRSRTAEPEDAWDRADVGFIHSGRSGSATCKRSSRRPRACEYYLCGPPLMIRAVFADARRTAGVERDLDLQRRFRSLAMRITRRSFLFSTAAAMAWPMGPAAAATVGIGGPAFGSTWRAALPDATDSVTVRKLVAAVVAEINQAMSPYLEQSELSVFNRTETVDWQNCSTPLADVAGHALEISRQTEGAFDPTIGPLVNRFGFGPIHGERVHPADLSVSANGLRKRVPGLTLDLCGIAKGYALDRIIEALPAVGVDSAMFELGGEIRTRSGVIRTGGPGRSVSSGRMPSQVSSTHVVTPWSSGSGDIGNRKANHQLGRERGQPPDRSAVRPTGRRPASICVGAGCIRDARGCPGDRADGDGDGAGSGVRRGSFDPGAFCPV